MGNTRYVLLGASREEITPKLLYVSSSLYEEDWPSLKHAHYFSELFYIRSGSGKFLVENRELPVTRDDLLIINPNVEHTEMSAGDDPLDYIVLGVEGLSFTFDETEDFLLYNYKEYREKLLFYFESILEEISGKAANYELVCQNQLEILLIHIMRHSQRAFSVAPAQKISPECSRIKKYIDSHFAEDITLALLAERVHLNKFYLVHAFTRCYGMSPMSYLSDRRIQCSRELLESTDHSIAQIAQLAGFSSQSYFSQSFRKACGVSAGVYRKQTRALSDSAQ